MEDGEIWQRRTEIRMSNKNFGIKVKEETLSSHKEDEAVRGVTAPVMYFAHSKLQRKKTPTESPTPPFNFN